MNNVTNAPVAKEVNDSITIHNDTRVDEFSWLRDNDWPNVSKEDVLEYLKAENNYTNNFLSPYKKLEEKIFNELKGYIKEDDISYPIEDEGYLYYSKINKGQNYSVYCRKKINSDKSVLQEEIMLDVNELAKNHNSFSLGVFAIDPKHNLVAYSTDEKGEERYNLVIKDLVSNQLMKDYLTNVRNVVWHEIESGFFYTKINDDWRSKEVFYHKLGDSQDHDKLIFKEKDNTFSVGISKSSDKNYLFISTHSSDSDETYFIDIKEHDFKPKIIFKRKKDLFYSVDHKQGEFYFLINDKGKNFRLVKVDKNSFNEKEKWYEIIPHKEEIYITDFDLSKEYMVVNLRINGLDKIKIYDNNLNYKYIKFDEETYAASAFFPTYDSNLLRLGYSSLTTPNSVLEYDFINEEIFIRKEQEIPSGYNKDLYKAERLNAVANDGQQIPISLVYRKDKFKQDGSNPLYLYGYGSYGISVPPSFRTSTISLLDRGVVFAIAHIRGGDDLGFNWYEQTKFLNKRVTFDDFINCAEHLIKNQYTNNENLVISGGSAGGMLMGVVVNERPDLFKAVIARVPFVDVLNTMLDESLPLTPGEFKEWGNPKNIEYYNYIKSYSPYDNVKKQDYPAMFITAGLTDPRVTYWEPAKWTAKLRKYNTSKNPILFYTEMDSGHQGQTGRYDSLKELAKVYCFIFIILGMA